jgi:hypothetical protein
MLLYDVDGKLVPMPELLILANRQGYLELADYFTKLANAGPKLSARRVDPDDPDDHRHLEIREAPFDPRLSDDLEMRFGIITPKNRRAVLEKYGITADNRGQGTLIEQYRRHIAEAKLAVSGRGKQERRPPIRIV